MPGQQKHDKVRNLWDAVTEKFGKEPRNIEKLREEEEGRVVYRVFWREEGAPSTVVVAVWKEDDTLKFRLQEAFAPVKGGLILGNQ